jgi:asparagine synthase (glutamine-hydrolysing)
VLRRATERLAHRGPDGQGCVGWCLDGALRLDSDLTNQALGVGLGHRRLKILDLTDAGRQPMQGPGGRWITFNGEIYNYQELREGLSSLGYRFHSGTDTEVILAAYDVWGPECVRRFNGMWAFVLHDPGRRRLFASRDRLGVKPLYYATTPRGTMFASEVGALLECPEVRPTIVMRRLGRYLVDRRIDDTAETMYRDIRELPGGHTLELDTETGAIRLARYWDLPDEPDLELSDEAALDRFSELIEGAVRLRLHADVPVAITLSGGVDSSVLTVAASRVAGRCAHTFTSRFPENPALDESRYAASVVAASGADGHYVQPSTDRLIDEEVSLTSHQALPFRSLSLYVHWAILAAIRAQGVPVVLSGQGGDETFLGYDRYHASTLLRALPNAARAALGLWQGARRSDRGVLSLAKLAVYFMLPALQRTLRRGRMRQVIHAQWLEGLGQPLREVFGDIRQQQRSELLSRCLPSLLRYDDRTAGALGMETRLPFLDYRVVEFAYRLPLRYKIRDGWTKYLLRCYLARHGLDAVAWRRRKYAFFAPHAAWTRRLIAARGSALEATRFTRALLEDGVSLARLPMPVAWDVYNCAHLARLLAWEADESCSRARIGAASRRAPPALLDEHCGHGASTIARSARP